MFEQTFKNIENVLWKEAGCTRAHYTEQTSWMLFLKYLDDLESTTPRRPNLRTRSTNSIIDVNHRWAVWAAPKNGSFDHDKALTGATYQIVDRKLFPYLKVLGPRRRRRHDRIQDRRNLQRDRKQFRSGYSLRDALELIDGLSFRSQ